MGSYKPHIGLYSYKFSLSFALPIKSCGTSKSRGVRVNIDRNIYYAALFILIVNRGLFALNLKFEKTYNLFLINTLHWSHTKSTPEVSIFLTSDTEGLTFNAELVSDIQHLLEFIYSFDRIWKV